jgi:transposase
MKGLSPDWHILATHETDEEYVVRIQFNRASTRCQHCGSVAEHIRFGRRKQRYRDLPKRGKPVSMVVHRQRCRCRDCGKIFLEALPDIDTHHRATQRLIEYIRQQALRRTFVSIAAEVGFSEGSIRNIYRGNSEQAVDKLADEVGANY